MKEIEFNLLTEPWIRVRLRDNTVREVSLTEALVSAQDYVDLAGEMPTPENEPFSLSVSDCASLALI